MIREVKSRTPRRAQLQAMEPILIIIILAVIIGIILVFYFRITKIDAGMNAQRLQSQEDVLTLIRISRMPELLCPKSESGTTNCIDLKKAEAFSAITADPMKRIYYNPMFGNSNITIYWIDNSMNVSQLQLYSGLLTSNATSISSSITYFSIYDPMDDTRHFAWVMIQKEVVS